jgi:hypothetical protein
LCLQHACGDSLSPQDKAAAKAAVQWILEPTEENRAATKMPAEAAGPASPTGALARAANQTGGNLAPPAPPMPPSPLRRERLLPTQSSSLPSRNDPVKIADTHRLPRKLGSAWPGPF